jgi:hypothetical protein
MRNDQGATGKEQGAHWSYPLNKNRPLQKILLDTIDMNFLHAEMMRTTERIAFDLSRQNKLTGCVTNLRYCNFDTYTKR